jgi:hypothetical protein
MHIDNVLREKIDETAQEIVVHCILDRKDKSPNYNYLQEQLQKLVDDSIGQYLDAQC